MKVLHFSYVTLGDFVYAEGIQAISRWLSEAIPPGCGIRGPVDPEGIAASRYAGTPLGCGFGYALDTGGGATLTSG